MFIYIFLKMILKFITNIIFDKKFKNIKKKFKF